MRQEQWSADWTELRERRAHCGEFRPKRKRQSGSEAVATLGESGRGNPGLQLQPLRAASRREAFRGPALSRPPALADQRGLRVRVFRFAAVLWTLIALAASSFFFFTGATGVDEYHGSWLSLGDIYRILAITNIIAAVLVLVRPRGWTGAIAFVVALVGAALVILPAFVTLSLPEGLPELPETTWTWENTALACAQGLALVGSLLVMVRRRR